GEPGAAAARRHRGRAGDDRLRAHDEPRGRAAAARRLVAGRTAGEGIMTAPPSGVVTRIPITAPLIGDQEIAAVAVPLRSGWLTQGPEVAAFEREFAEYVGAPHACAVSNCTTALHLALLALGVGPGDEVVTVSHSFIATANAVRYCGATPVFVDIDPATFNIAVAAIEPRSRREPARSCACTSSGCRAT